MKHLPLACLMTLCALAAPHAQAPAAQSRVTGTITLALDARETPRKLLHARETLVGDARRADARLSEMAARRAFARRADRRPRRAERSPRPAGRSHGDAILSTCMPFMSTFRRAPAHSMSRSISSLRLDRAASAPHRRRPRTSASIRGTRCCSIREARARTT